MSVDLVGIEIEGVFGEDPGAENPLMYDGSINVAGRQSTGPGLGHPTENLTGEVVSAPMPPEEAPAWVEDHYPKWVNKTCGLHIHASTDNLNFQYWMDERWHRFFMRRMREWASDNKNRLTNTFWDRLECDSRWARQQCEDRFQPDRQIYCNGDKHTRFNFNSYPRHGTMETRFLPAFGQSKEEVPQDSKTRGNPRLAADTVAAVIDIMEEYLSLNPGSTESTFRVECMPQKSEKEVIEL
jgi:hypothetical protein